MTPQLINLLQQNRMEEARVLCAELCRAHPKDAQTQFMMSAIYGQLGDFSRSEKYSRKAVKLNPNVAEAHFNLGIAQLRLKKIKTAIQSFKRALELRSTFPEACNELANAYQESGKLDEAIALYNQAINLRPQYADALCNLGCAQIKVGNLSEARSNLQSALSANPNLPEIYIQLAAIAKREEDLEAVEQQLRQAISLAPEHPEANLSLAELIVEKNPTDALALCQQASNTASSDKIFLTRLAVQYKQLGELKLSIECYRNALQAGPRDAQILSNLGVALKDDNQLDEAISIHGKALSVDPQSAEAHYNLAIALSAANRQEEAERSYRRAVELKPELVEAWTNLGSLLMLQGRSIESIDCFQAALATSPDYVAAASNRLFAMNYTPSISATACFDAHRQWGNSYPANTHTPKPGGAQRASDGVLRIGFVSGDFRHHSVAYFFESLLTHDDGKIEIHCYSNTMLIDAVTEKLRGQVAGWQDITRLNDAEASALIRNDGIDVLIDLAGHTNGHRLGIFALRPCPTQITYLGYPNTSGLPAMDYRITDEIADPQENDALNTEFLLRLKRCFLCYTPPLDAPTPIPPGKDTGPHITFGSFNNLAKVTPDVIRVWSEILKRVPDSVLIIKNRPLADASVAERIRSQFSEWGIPSERLELLAWAPGTDNHLELYNRVDIALDTFPYNGTTTTCEALWMGRPVVTLCGKTHASRVSASLLTHTELGELIAEDEQGYIKIAAELANNIAGFSAKHRNLRESVRRSSLCDQHDFQKDFFKVLRTAVINRD